MLAGKFAAGTGTFEGNVGQVNAGLIGLAAAALAFTPKRLFVGAAGDPFCRVGKIPACLFGGFVGSKRQYLVFSKAQ